MFQQLVRLLDLLGNSRPLANEGRCLQRELGLSLKIIGLLLPKPTRLAGEESSPVGHNNNGVSERRLPGPAEQLHC